MQSFLLSKYRDNDALPLIGNITPTKLIGFSSAIYVVAAVAFAMSFYSYTAFDALKTSTTTISTTGGSNCVILSPLNAVYTTASVGEPGPALNKMTNSPLAQCFADCYCLTGISKAKVNYESAYFSSYDNCVTAIGDGVKLVITSTRLKHNGIYSILQNYRTSRTVHNFWRRQGCFRVFCFTLQ